MNTRPDLRNPVPVGAWTPSWATWFTQIFDCLPWKKAMNTVHPLNFASIAAQGQASQTVTVEGARSGDAVTVHPASDIAGLVFTGAVTSDNSVTVYAKNFTAGAIDPASTNFRLIVTQN